MTQADRLLRALETAGPSGLTSMDIITRLGVVNSTGRVSDLRAAGHRIDCKRDARGHFVFHLVGQGTLGL